MLQRIGDIELPPHVGAGAFDQPPCTAAPAWSTSAHTANDASTSSTARPAVSWNRSAAWPRWRGALVSDDHDLVFTSNRGEDTVGMFAAAAPVKDRKIGVGVKPNGLAYDPVRRRLLAANVGDPARRDSFTVSLVDVDARCRLAEIPVPGRTRWTVWDPAAEVFHVNVMDPAVIVVVDAGRAAVTRTVDIPAPAPWARTSTSPPAGCSARATLHSSSSSMPTPAPSSARPRSPACPT